MGLLLRSDGVFQVAKYNDTPAYINRTGSQMVTLIDLRKSGTTVGSVGYNLSALTLDGGSSRSGLYFGDGAILPMDTTAP